VPCLLVLFEHVERLFALGRQLIGRGEGGALQGLLAALGGGG